MSWSAERERERESSTIVVRTFLCCRDVVADGLQGAARSFELQVQVGFRFRFRLEPQECIMSIRVLTSVDKQAFVCV